MVGQDFVSLAQCRVWKCGSEELVTTDLLSQDKIIS